MILYSSENRSDQPSEEFSSDEGSDYSSVVSLYSVVSLIAIVERGQGPLYIVESEWGHGVAIVECGLNGYGRGIYDSTRGHHRHHGCTVLARFYTVFLILQD